MNSNRFLDALALVACAVALTVALRTVDGLAWPYDGDHYRDIAQAQTARDGHPLSDPHYQGEWIWYNPLLPWIVAAGSAIARVPPAAFHVQAGPYLNLLAPLGFYVLGSRLAGRGAAFAALVVFLFFNSRTDPALVSPTYSCWLFVATFTQGFFFLTLLAIRRASEAPSQRRAAIVGCLAGLTFLAHTAPALVLGGIAPFLLPRRVWLTTGAFAVLVASPFLYAIVWQYGAHIVNPVPMAWAWPAITVKGFAGTLTSSAVLIASGAAGVFVVRDKTVRAWLIVSLALTAYGLACELWPPLPRIVPTFHFWRYAVAALTLCAGATVWWVCERTTGRYAVATMSLLACIAVLWDFPQYRGRFDFVYGQAIAQSRPPAHALLTALIRKLTPDGAVILGTRGASLQIIGPAGRHVVAVNANWSNPYLENVARVQARDAMLDALHAHDSARFTSLADEYRVTHVVGVGDDECAEMTGPDLRLLYRAQGGCLFDRGPVD